MKDEKDGIKLLDDLEKLNGLPLEKKGTEIKKSLNIDENLLQKIEDISGPYILIEGARNKAINLAANIYLNKICSVHSDVYLHEEQKGGAAASPLRKAKKGENIYLELWQVKNKTEGKPIPLTYCKYVNKKTGRNNGSDFRIDDYCYDLVRHDFYYKGNRDKPDEAKGEPIEIIYQNHFRYVDRKNSHPGILNTLKIIDEGDVSMTYCEMLQFKNTVFLLDFMMGIKNEDIDCDELRTFSNELHELRKGMPGSLIIHTDSVRKWPPRFRELFYKNKIKLGKTNAAQAKTQALTENSAKRLSYKDNPEYMKILDQVLKKHNKRLKEYPSIGKLVMMVMEKMESQKLIKKKWDKDTREFKDKQLYSPNSVKTHIQNHQFYKEIMKRKKKTKGKK